MDLLTSIFSHPVIAVAFSGIGVTIISGIVKFIKTNYSKKVQSTQHIAVESTPPQPSQLQQDIQIIKNSILRDYSYAQKETFVRFFNKYKDKFKTEDITTLQVESSKISPDYGILLSALLGLIESIQE